MTRELQLILDLLVDNPVLIDKNVKWEMLLQLATGNGVQSLLYKRLLKLDIPIAIRSACQTEERSNLFANLSLAAEVIRIHEAALANGIAVLPYKGKVWSVWLYGDVNYRPPGDIDILVEEKDVNSIITVLATLGYSIDPYKAYLLQQNEHIKRELLETDYHIPLFLYNERREVMRVVEVHWKIAYPRLCFDFDDWKLYQNQLLSFQNISLPYFQNEYLLLLLIVHHGGKERWNRLKYFADLYAYLQAYGTTTDWGLVERLARQKGIYSLLQHSLSLANRIKPVSCVPSTLLIPISERHFRRLILEWQTLNQLPENATLPYLQHALRTRDWAYKWKVALAHIRFLQYARLHRAKLSWKSQTKHSQ